MKRPAGATRRAALALCVVAAATLAGCASPEPRAVAIDPARVRAFAECPRPESRRDGVFRALLADRLTAHGGDILALADELRGRGCFAEVFVSPPVETFRELHLTYREGNVPAWVVTIVYDAEGFARVGDAMPKGRHDPR